MIRPEAVRLAVPDPHVERRLLNLRDTVVSIDHKVAALADKKATYSRDYASTATKVRVDEALNRDRKHQSLYRLPDAELSLRPYTQQDTALWASTDLRRWYERPTEAPGQLHTQAANTYSRASSGEALLQTGYLSLKPDPRSSTVFRPDPGASMPRAIPIAASRMAATMPHKYNLAATHWLNRDAVIAAEKQLANAVVKESGYTPQLVNTSRPWKNRPLEEECGIWDPPTKDQLLAREQQLFVAANDAAHGREQARARKLAITASTPAAYFGLS